MQIKTGPIRRMGPDPDMTKTQASTPLPLPETNKSLGLKALCDRLADRSGISILDLGSALGINVAFWSRFFPAMQIADIWSSMPEPAPPSQEPVEPYSGWPSILALPEEAGFDVILAWDLLNYLDQQQVTGLVRHLNGFCRSGALLFALIFDQPQMSVVPIRFKIAGTEQLIYETRTTETRPCPRHQPRDVQRMLSGFRTASSFRLRNGIQEYVFEFEG
jgi:hypothetical protein